MAVRRRRPLPPVGLMKELKAETSTQKIYWDSENAIVWGELTANVTTEELAREDIDAQERVRDGLNRKKTRVLVDMRAMTEVSKGAEGVGWFTVRGTDRSNFVIMSSSALPSKSATILIDGFRTAPQPGCRKHFGGADKRPFQAASIAAERARHCCQCSIRNEPELIHSKAAEYQQ